MTIDLILAVHSSFDITGLNKCNNLLFNFFNGPPKCGAHPLELDRGKWLEVEYDSPVADQICEVMDMWCEVNVDVVASLHDVSSEILKCFNRKLHTEYRDSSSRTVLKLLLIYASMSSRTYGSCSI